jgi:hypothetical protein
MIEIPEARWGGPVDSKWDQYYSGFERWVNDHYDMPSQSIFGMQMTWEQATESEDLLDDYIERLYRV